LADQRVCHVRRAPEQESRQNDQCEHAYDRLVLAHALLSLAALVAEAVLGNFPELRRDIFHVDAEACFEGGFADLVLKTVTGGANWDYKTVARFKRCAAVSARANVTGFNLALAFVGRMIRDRTAESAAELEMAFAADHSRIAHFHGSFLATKREIHRASAILPVA
jgi:hypothetical protein